MQVVAQIGEGARVVGLLEARLEVVERVGEAARSTSASSAARSRRGSRGRTRRRRRDRSRARRSWPAKARRSPRSRAFAAPPMRGVISRPQSSSSITFWLRSTSCCATISLPRRAVAFQSIARKASPSRPLAQRLELGAGAAQPHAAQSGFDQCDCARAACRSARPPKDRERRGSSAAPERARGGAGGRARFRTRRRARRTRRRRARPAVTARAIVARLARGNDAGTSSSASKRSVRTGVSTIADANARAASDSRSRTTISARTREREVLGRRRSRVISQHRAQGPSDRVGNASRPRVRRRKHDRPSGDEERDAGRARQQAARSRRASRGNAA